MKKNFYEKREKKSKEEKSSSFKEVFQGAFFCLKSSCFCPKEFRENLNSFYILLFKYLLRTY